MEQCLAQIGMALEIPYELLVRRFQSSFSAARAALLDAWRVFRIKRAHLVCRVCQPVYEAWLADAVALGIIQAPGFFADPLIRAAWCGTKWAGDGPGAIDPEKEARGAEQRMKIGLTSLDEEIAAYDGGDWAAKHRAQVRIHKARSKEGLFSADGEKAPPVQQQPGQDQPRKDGQPPDQPQQQDKPADQED
jgi:capsid protein